MKRQTTHSQKLSFDSHGRMRYHPEIHTKQGLPWTTLDEKHLIEFYEKLGPEQISFELGRTIHTVMTKAYNLRKAGRMKKRQTTKLFRRTVRANP